jgi:protocatechuate 3,4-dioxygenase beta subunit
MKPAPLGFLLFGFCVALAAQPAGISGVVINQVSGEPVAGAHVRFITGDFDDSGSTEPTVYGAISGRDGRFSVTEMKPGLYFVFPERTGFVAAPGAKGGPSPFLAALKKGQQITDYKVRMVPSSTISGRVLDEYGDPVQHANVQVESVSDSGSNSMDFFGQDQGNTTDDRGEFHITIAPGRHYIKADRNSNGPRAVEIRTDGTSAAPYVSTYYPSTSSRGSASLVQTGPGQNVGGIEITLQRTAAPAGNGKLLSVSGVVTGTTEYARLRLSREDGPDQEQGVQPGANSFSFHRLEPGTYHVTAFSNSGKNQLRSLPVEVTLTGDNVTGLQVMLAPGEEITGTVEIAKTAGAGAAAEKRTVRLEPTGPYEGEHDTSDGDVDARGAFHIGNIFPGSFRIVVDPIPEDGYIQSVTLDNRPVENQTLDLTRGAKGSRVKITINRDGAQLSGSVTDQEGQPLLSAMVEVCLVSDPKQLQNMMGNDAHKAIDGKYSIKGIRPGKYRLLAIDLLTIIANSPNLDTDDDDEAMKSIFNAGEEIEIKAGERLTKDLKALDKIPAKK